MKKLLILAVLAVGLIQSGCGMVDSVADRHRRINDTNNLQARMFVDDWDYFWLYERSSRLTPWHVTIGH